LLRGADGARWRRAGGHLARAAASRWPSCWVGNRTHPARTAAGLATAENPRWAQGRASSLQAGIAAFPEADGYLFLPVDAVGARPATVRAVLAAAAQEPAAIWRPTHRGAPGHLLWLPRAAAQELLALPADARVDEWARARSRALEVDDPAILRNANTPAEWAALQGAP
jgi:molybdenum cofactor cytidylyltransferase